MITCLGLGTGEFGFTWFRLQGMARFTDPAALTSRDTDDHGIGGNITSNDGPSPYEGVFADRDATNDGAISPQRRTLLHPGLTELGLALDEGAGIDYICKHHGRTAEYSIFKYDPFVNGDIVLQLATVANVHIPVDVDILADAATGADTSTGHDVTEVPDVGVVADFDGFINTGCRVDASR